MPRNSLRGGTAGAYVEIERKKEVKNMEQKERFWKKARSPKIFLAFLFAAILLASIVPTASADGWNWRRAINITNSGNTLTDYQVLVTLNTSNFEYSKANDDGSDLRFTNYANSTAYHYWIETWNTAGDSRIWVKVPSVPVWDGTGEAPSANRMYMWYNNSAASSESNGTNIFEFFDDFEGTSLDGKWTVDGAIFYSVSDSILTVTDAPSSTWNVWKGIHASINNIQGVRIEAKSINWVHQSSDLFQWGALLGEHPTGNKNLGMNIVDFHDLPSEAYLNYYYDTSSLSKDNIEGQQPVDLVAQRDQNGNCKFFKNGIEQQAGTETSTNSIDTVMLLVNRYSNYAYPTTKIDRVLVRKYASPEPTTTVSATEEDVTGPVDPVPELPTVILFSIGLLVLAGYAVLRRKKG